MYNLYIISVGFLLCNLHFPIIDKWQDNASKVSIDAVCSTVLFRDIQYNTRCITPMCEENSPYIGV